MRILIVEDDHAIAQAIKTGLEQESFAVDMVFDGEDGYNSARYEDYDLIILDIMLPGMTGLEVAQRLRQAKIHSRILMLSAKSEIPDRVRGLNTGADDYLAKPFSFEELLARVQALLRRPSTRIAEVLEVADLSLNTFNKEVRRAGRTINLSTKEYALLEYLMRNRGRVLSKNNIMNHVWDFEADILPNTVEVFINYLRAKIEKPFGGAKLIHTVRGFGYKIDA